MKLGLIISNDWELFGDGSGDYFEVQHRPLEALLQTVEDHGAKLTVMAEVAQQWAHQRISPHAPWAREVVEAWESILRVKDVSTRAEAFIESQKPHYIAVVNAAKLVKMRGDKELRQSIQAADIVGADGVPVVWASWLLGSPLPGRVNGTDLMMELLEKGDQHGYRIFFFGARAEVLDRVLDVVRTDYPGVKMAGSRHGYFTKGEEWDIVRQIQASHADILFITFGTPKKELWIKDYLQAMQVPVVHGVGGSFDILAGVIPRAPQ